MVRVINNWRAWVRKNINLIVVLVVVIGISGGSLILASNVANSQATQDARIRQAQQKAQEKAGQVVENKLCTTFGRLASLQPPPGNPTTNPSRAYLQDQHEVLVQLGQDIGCKTDPPNVTTHQEEVRTGRQYRNGHNR